MNLDAVRSCFPGTSRRVYLNAAAQGLLPMPVAEEVARVARLHASEGINAYPQYVDGLRRFRSGGARLLGTAPENVAVAASTAAAISQVASGLDWRPGDEVVVGDAEFPALVLPWLAQQRHGARLRFVPTEGGRLPAERIVEAIGPRTRAVAVSHVQWTTGYRTDLRPIGEACAERGVLFCVDAIQSLGVLPVDVHGLRISALAADGRKWLLGPQGCALLYVAPEWAARLAPQAVGTASLREPEALLGFRDWDRDGDAVVVEPHLHADARRFEIGYPESTGIAGLARALEFAESLGRPSIRARVETLVERAVQRLTEAGLAVVGPRTASERAGIVAFRAPGVAADVYGRLTEAGFSISLREGLLRLSPHVYNTEDEIDRCVAAAVGART